MTLCLTYAHLLVLMPSAACGPGFKGRTQETHPSPCILSVACMHTQAASPAPSQLASLADVQASVDP